MVKKLRDIIQIQNISIGADNFIEIDRHWIYSKFSIEFSLKDHIIQFVDNKLGTVYRGDLRTLVINWMPAATTPEALMNQLRDFEEDVFTISDVEGIVSDYVEKKYEEIDSSTGVSYVREFVDNPSNLEITVENRDASSNTTTSTIESGEDHVKIENKYVPATGEVTSSYLMLEHDSFSLSSVPGVNKISEIASGNSEIVLSVTDTASTVQKAEVKLVPGITSIEGKLINESGFDINNVLDDEYITKSYVEEGDFVERTVSFTDSSGNKYDRTIVDEYELEDDYVFDITTTFKDNLEGREQEGILKIAPLKDIILEHRWKSTTSTDEGDAYISICSEENPTSLFRQDIDSSGSIIKEIELNSSHLYLRHKFGPSKKSEIALSEDLIYMSVVGGSNAHVSIDQDDVTVSGKLLKDVDQTNPEDKEYITRKYGDEHYKNESFTEHIIQVTNPGSPDYQYSVDKGLKIQAMRFDGYLDIEDNNSTGKVFDIPFIYSDHHIYVENDGHEYTDDMYSWKKEDSENPGEYIIGVTKYNVVAGSYKVTIHIPDIDIKGDPVVVTEITGPFDTNEHTVERQLSDGTPDFISNIHHTEIGRTGSVIEARDGELWFGTRALEPSEQDPTPVWSWLRMKGGALGYQDTINTSGGFGDNDFITKSYAKAHEAVHTDNTLTGDGTLTSPLGVIQATIGNLGIVKPDGVTIGINSFGTIGVIGGGGFTDLDEILEFQDAGLGFAVETNQGDAKYLYSPHGIADGETRSLALMGENATVKSTGNIILQAGAFDTRYINTNIAQSQDIRVGIGNAEDLLSLRNFYRGIADTEDTGARVTIENTGWVRIEQNGNPDLRPLDSAATYADVVSGGGGGGGGGILEVIHDSTLTGKGTTAFPLGIDQIYHDDSLTGKGTQANPLNLTDWQYFSARRIAQGSTKVVYNDYSYPYVAIEVNSYTKESDRGYIHVNYYDIDISSLYMASPSVFYTSNIKIHAREDQSKVVIEARDLDSSSQSVRYWSNLIVENGYVTVKQENYVGDTRPNNSVATYGEVISAISDVDRFFVRKSESTASGNTQTILNSVTKEEINIGINNDTTLNKAKVLLTDGNVRAEMKDSSFTGYINIDGSKSIVGMTSSDSSILAELTVGNDGLITADMSSTDKPANRVATIGDIPDDRILMGTYELYRSVETYGTVVVRQTGNVRVYEIIETDNSTGNIRTFTALPANLRPHIELVSNSSFNGASYNNHRNWIIIATDGVISYQNADMSAIISPRTYVLTYLVPESTPDQMYVQKMSFCTQKLYESTGSSYANFKVERNGGVVVYSVWPKSGAGGIQVICTLPVELRPKVPLCMPGAPNGTNSTSNASNWCKVNTDGVVQYVTANISPTINVWFSVPYLDPDFDGTYIVAKPTTWTKQFFGTQMRIGDQTTRTYTFPDGYVAPNVDYTVYPVLGPGSTTAVACWLNVVATSTTGFNYRWSSHDLSDKGMCNVVVTLTGTYQDGTYETPRCSTWTRFISGATFTSRTTPVTTTYTFPVGTNVPNANYNITINADNSGSGTSYSFTPLFGNKTTTGFEYYWRNDNQNGTHTTNITLNGWY